MPGGSFLCCYEGAVQLRGVSGSRRVSDFNKRASHWGFCGNVDSDSAAPGGSKFLMSSKLPSDVDVAGPCHTVSGLWRWEWVAERREMGAEVWVAVAWRLWGEAAHPRFIPAPLCLSPLLIGFLERTPSSPYLTIRLRLPH